MVENEKFDKPVDSHPNESQPCCEPTSDQSDCCSSGSEGSKGLRSVVFVVVILVACVVAAHSLITRGNKTTNNSSQLDPFRTDLATLELFKSEADGHEAVFLLLADESAEPAENLLQQIKQAAIKITAKGTSIGTFTIDRKSNDFALLTENLSIDSIPSVVAVVRGCGNSVVSGQITETKLLEAFIAASTASSCCPGSDPSCCPK